MFIADYIKQMEKSYEALYKVLISAIEQTEKDIGRPMTSEEKEICVKLGVPLVFLKVIGEKDK